MQSSASRTGTTIKTARIAGIFMLVAGTFLFLFVVFAGIAYPVRGMCGAAISPEYAQPCTWYDPRPEFLKPIMNLEFGVFTVGLAASGAAILAVAQFKASRAQKRT